MSTPGAPVNREKLRDRPENAPKVQSLASPTGAGQEGGGMNERILPEYETVEVPDLTEAVYQALGAASVFWEPMDCTGVFMSERAGQLGEELLGIIRQWADGRDCDGSCADTTPGTAGESVS